MRAREQILAGDFSIEMPRGNSAAWDIVIPDPAAQGGMFDWTEAVIDTVVLIGSYEHDVPGPVFTFNPAVPGRAILEFTATLTGSLPAGKYTYRVQATKPSGRRTLLHSALWLAESNFDSDTIPPGPSIHPGGDSFVDFSLIFENHLI